MYVSVLPAIGRQLGVALWWTALVLAVGVAGLLFGRRMAGAFVESLSGVALLCMAVVIVLAAAALQFCQPLGRLGLIVPALAAVLGLTAVTLPDAAPWSIGLSWFLLVTGEAGVLYVALNPRRLALRPARAAPRADASRAGDATEEVVSEHLIQQLTRERTASGGEALHALVRATCPPGDRLAVVHLAFCPPLDAAPRLTAHVLDDSGAEANVTLAETYGARIEIRLAQSAAEDSRSILLEVVGEAGISPAKPDQTPASPPHRHP